MDEEKYTVCVVTGTRAEYGLLRNLLFALKYNEIIKLNLVVTGSHLSERFGNTQREIYEDGFENYCSISILDEDDSKEGMAVATGIALQKFAKYFAKNRPDCLIVLGDRFEILAAVIAAHLEGIRIVHIGGGDITEGAVDDSIRHCITKMSDLHFPGCRQSARRIIQMGESPERVFDVGEPGIENCLQVPLMSKKELSESLTFDIQNQPFAVVTFHPVTMEEDTAKSQIYELIAAMETIDDIKYIITMANADAGGRMINDIWLKENDKHENWFVTPSLGMERYLSAVKHAKVVIGNSSSGIIEAPALGTPTVNIGDRQKGRMMEESILQCKPEKQEILQAMQKALTSFFQEKAKNIVSPFGDGTTTKQIMKQLLDFLEKRNQDKEKGFFDIDFNLGGEQH